jgi:uncharacterized protein
VNTVAAGSAFVAGLLSSGHCFGMCGGIVGAFSLRSGMTTNPSGGSRLLGLLTYNLGRISTYVALGALVGALGATVGRLLPPAIAQRIAQLVAALFLVGVGLFLAGRPQILRPIERLGARLWRVVEPLGRGRLPSQGRRQALALGLFWGFLPCGLVYSMLVLASLAGGPADGAFVMLAFGAGTLPALLAAGLAASRLQGVARSTALRRCAAAAYIALGTWLAFSAIVRPPHAHGASAAAGDTCPDSAPTH